MTLFERDALAILLSLNTVYCLIMMPIAISAYTLNKPIHVLFDNPMVYIATVAIGLPIGAIGILINHYTAHPRSR